LPKGFTQKTKDTISKVKNLLDGAVFLAKSCDIVDPDDILNFICGKNFVAKIYQHRLLKTTKT